MCSSTPTSEVGLLELADDHVHDVPPLDPRLGFLGHDDCVAVDDLAVEDAADDDGEEAEAHEDGAGVAQALGGVVSRVTWDCRHRRCVAVVADGRHCVRDVAKHTHASATCEGGEKKRRKGNKNKTKKEKKK